MNAATSWVRCSAGCKWTGLARAHCAGCHQTFSVVSNFDKHRNDGRCVDPAAAGLIAVDGVWQMPHGYSWPEDMTP